MYTYLCLLWLFKNMTVHFLTNELYSESIEIKYNLYYSIHLNLMMYIFMHV